MKQKMYLLTYLTHQSASLIAKHLASEIRVNSYRRVWIQISAAGHSDKHTYYMTAHQALHGSLMLN